MSRAALLDALAQAGTDVSRPSSIRCPFHDDRHPSAAVKQAEKTGEWYFVCYVCEWNRGKRFGNLRSVLRATGRPLVEFVHPIRPEKKVMPAPVDWNAALKRFQHDNATALGVRIGVGDETIRRFGVRWNGKEWLIPVWQPKEGIVGIQRRIAGTPDLKITMKGSRWGYFVPDGYHEVKYVLFVCEGFSDAAAMCHAGYQAVGRFCATHHDDGILDALEACDAKRKGLGVAVMADDDKAGAAGARACCKRLQAAGYKRAIILTPPAKDIREWLRNDAGNSVKTWLRGCGMIR